MVQINKLAVAMTIGSAAAAPHVQLPALKDLLSSFTLPAGFTLPAYGAGSSSTTAATAPGYGAPGYGAGASSSTVAPSATKSASSGASKPVSSIVPTGTATTRIPGVIPSGGSGSVTSSLSVPAGSGTAPVVSKSPSASGVSTSKAPDVSVSAVPGTSKVPGSGTAPAGSGTSPVGTVKTTIKTLSTSKSSASASKPVASGSSGRPVASSAASGSVRPKPPSTTGSSPRPTVSTTSGKVVGYPAPNTTDVYQYLGIKFGQAPVGDLRFAPPVAYTGTGTINGSAFRENCPCINLNVPKGLDPRLSSLFNTLAQTDIPLAEDCLFVNVWAKANSVNKPVLVWIYGGGFNFGGSNSAAYNGRYFAKDEDVVFVSFNYRTNILGFSGAPGITQNVGLLDQRLAIEWIRDNIAAFGGDPSRITIFGQSAGGASVDLYTFAHYEDPIIAGAIPMSGSSNSFGLRTADQALFKWDNVTTYIGCGNSTDTPAETVLACMRSPNTTWEVIEEIAKSKPGLNSLLGNFGPVIDETTVFSNYTGRVFDGKVAKVPVLTGNDNYESGLLSLIAIGAGESYPQATWDYIDLQIFTCPISRIARYRGQVGIPSWRYYYSAGWPNLVLPTANLTQGWHTGEIPVIFGVADEITGVANSENETALGDYIRGVWADFAADPLSPGSKYGWPEYSTGQLINLGLNHETTGSYSNASAIETQCQF